MSVESELFYWFEYDVQNIPWNSLPIVESCLLLTIFKLPNDAYLFYKIFELPKDAYNSKSFYLFLNNQQSNIVVTYFRTFKKSICRTSKNVTIGLKHFLYFLMSFNRYFRHSSVILEVKLSKLESFHLDSSKIKLKSFNLNSSRNKVKKFLKNFIQIG